MLPACAIPQEDLSWMMANLGLEGDVGGGGGGGSDEGVTYEEFCTFLDGQVRKGLHNPPRALHGN